MKFMLMMNAPGAKGHTDWAINEWPAADFKRHIDFMKSINRELVKEGVFVQAEGLAPPDQAKLVRANETGAPVTDGPFAETKEFLAGFWILDVESAEQAYAIAARVSLAPGKGGVPMYLPVEVRQVMSAPLPT